MVLSLKLLLHAALTDFEQRYLRYGLCKRFGWSMSSDMPAVYIDREGVEENEVGDQLMDEQAGKLRKEVNQLREHQMIMESQMKLME